MSFFVSHPIRAWIVAAALLANLALAAGRQRSPVRRSALVLAVAGMGRLRVLGASRRPLRLDHSTGPLSHRSGAARIDSRGAPRGVGYSKSLSAPIDVQASENPH